MALHPQRTRTRSVWVHGSGRLLRNETEPVPAITLTLKPRVYPNPCYSLAVLVRLSYKPITAFHLGDVQVDNTVQGTTWEECVVW